VPSEPPWLGPNGDPADLAAAGEWLDGHLREQARRRLRLRLRAAAVVLAVLLLGVCVWTAHAWRVIGAAAAVDDAAPSDAVVVLGCEVLPGGAPSPALRARTEHGVAVWRATRSRCLLLTGGPVTDPTPEAAVMARLAAAAGVPPGALVTDNDARNTEENARNCARIARERGWRRVTLVSDPWHLYRARRLFVAAGIPDVRQSPAIGSPDWTDPWRRRRLTLRESAALAWLALRGVP
jgi:uncharacterized SAM-binding protein YcdF (DUF218 family)